MLFRTVVFYLFTLMSKKWQKGFDQENVDPQVVLERERDGFSTCRRQRRKRRLYCTLCICTCVWFFIVVSGLINGGVRLAFALHRTTVKEGSLFDTKALFVSTRGNGALCSRLNVEVEQRNFHSRVSVYSLIRPPVLDGYSNISVRANLNIEAQNSFLFWSGFLYRDSSISLTACSSVEDQAEILFFLDANSYRQWEADPKTSESAYHSATVSAVCPSSQMMDVRVPEEGSSQWYIAVRNKKSNNVSVRMSGEVGRKVYSIKESDIINSCVTGGNNKCTIPTTDDATYIVTFAQAAGSTDSQTANVEVECVSGEYIFAVIIVPIVLFLLFLGIFVLICIRHLRKKACEGNRSVHAPPVIEQEGVEMSVGDKSTVKLSTYQPAVIPTGRPSYKSAA